jgi:hypothetical protein
MADTAATTAEKTTEPAAEEALSGVAQRVAELRKAAQDSPATAADAAWALFKELGGEARSDREAAAAKLDELFRLGTPPTGIDGQTEGILVTPLIQPAVDRALNLLTGAWMPWLGKRFDRDAAMGDNTLTGSTRLVAKNDPDRDVLVIDYYPIESNPGFIIRQIRDELVEIVPGANLGKILWRRNEDDHALIGYFALRSTNA